MFAAQPAPTPRQPQRRWRRVADIHGLDQAMFQGIAEALGYSRNKLPMSVLAQRLPLKFLQQRSADAGALLYEHLPLLGSVIAWMKRRLA